MKLPAVSLVPGDSIDITGADLRVTPTTTLVTVSSPAIGVPPPPPPPPTGHANILGVDIPSRPNTGAAWDRIVAASKAAGPVGLTTYNGDTTAGKNEGALLALAIYAARSGDTAARSKVVSIASAALSPNIGSARTLEVARNLAPIAIALNLIGEHSLDGRLRYWRGVQAASQGSVVDCHRKRPNNWGTVSGLARLAVSAHLGDTADIAEAAKIHRGWLGDRTAWASFAYGALSWQLDTSKPVGINPKSAVKSGVNIDGVLPDDQRRANSFPTWDNQNYVWQALGEAAATQFILRANGYPDVFSWSDAAVARAYARYAAHSYKATGDDAWQYAAAAAHGVTIGHDGFAPGKSFGWVDWLFG